MTEAERLVTGGVRGAGGYHWHARFSSGVAAWQTALLGGIIRVGNLFLVEHQRSAHVLVAKQRLALPFVDRDNRESVLRNKPCR